MQPKVGLITISKDSELFTSLQSEGALEIFNNVNGVDINIMVANVEGEHKAYTSVCPHAGTNNQWSFSNNSFICGHHGSEFNSNGVKTKSPATSNLSSKTIVSSSAGIIVSY